MFESGLISEVQSFVDVCYSFLSLDALQGLPPAFVAHRFSRSRVTDLSGKPLALEECHFYAPEPATIQLY